MLCVLRKILTYASVFYFVLARIILLYLLKWWGYMELWYLACEIPQILPQTPNQRILWSILMGGYCVSLNCMLIQQSKYVRSQVPLIHKYVGYLVYTSITISLVTLPSLTHHPIVLLYGAWIGLCTISSFVNIRVDIYAHKRWSEILYYSLYGMVFFQIVGSWLYTFSVDVKEWRYLTPTLFVPLISLKLKNTRMVNTFLLFFQLLTAGSVVYNILVHLGKIQQKVILETIFKKI